MLPQELNYIFQEYTEDDYSLYVTKANYSEDILVVDFSISVQNINEKGEINQSWSIQACGHRNNHISFGLASFIEVKNEHPLLWEYTDTPCELYFNGQCKEPAKLFYDLYITHKMLFGTFKNFDISIFQEGTYFKPFEFSNGLLTKGPKKLIKMYASCLQNNGLDFTIIEEKAVQNFNGKYYNLENSNLKIIFLGDTYIIAKEISFERLD